MTDNPVDSSATDISVGDEIPDIVVGRLPIYLRTLRLLHSQGAEVTSSQELGVMLGISSAQIRKDLSHFGEFGKQGTGYNVPFLCGQLEKILKVDCVWPVVLVGAGYLGHVLAAYNGFEHRGFRIVGVFDSSSEKIGMQIGDLTVLPTSAIPQIVMQYHCRIGVIAVPAGAAQAVANQLVRSAFKAFFVMRQLPFPCPLRFVSNISIRSFTFST